jgi:hypothetical protein
MKIQNNIDNNIISNVNKDSSIKVGIDLASMEFLMGILSTNLYSNTIGTPIQEIASNGLDSNVMAGNKEPIIVSLLKNEAEQWELSIEDFGLGLDSSEFNEIMNNFGSSTKRDREDALGFMGIGKFSPFSYTNTYSYIGRKNGVECKYIFRKAEIGFSIDCIYERPTEERNGVKVIIPVLERDYNSFKKEIKEKLAYFDDVYFNIQDNYSNEILESINNFNIIEYPDFKWSSLDENNKTKILLGKINYELNYKELGLMHYTIPIAINFSLSDNIYPTPNREGIKYTYETKTIILLKLKKICEYMVESYNNNLEEIDDIKKWFKFHMMATKYFSIKDKENKILSSFDINVVLKCHDEICNTLYNTKSTLELKLPTLKEIPYLSQLKGKESNSLPFLYYIRTNIFRNYKYIAKFNDQIYSTKGLPNSNDKFLAKILDNDNIIISNNQISSANYQRDYLKDKYEGYSYKYVIKPRTLPLFLGEDNLNEWERLSNDYYSILNLKQFPKEDWDKIIEEFDKVEELLLKHCLKAKDLKPTKEYIDSKKKAKINNYSNVATKTKEEINLKLATHLEKWSSDWNCKFEPQIIEIEKLHKLRGTIVYGELDDRKILDNIYKFSNNVLGRDKGKGTILPSILGIRDIEKVKDLKIHNFKSIKQFMEENERTIGNYVTAHKVHLFLNNKKSDFLIRNKNFIEENISERVSNNLQALLKFKETYRNIHNFDNKFAESLKEIATKNNWKNLEIESLLEETEKDLLKLNFLKFLEENNRSYNYGNDNISADKIPFIHETLRNRKFRMDSKHYPLIKNLTEEIVPIENEEIKTLETIIQ